jgi:hypothetical protein
LNGCNIGIIGGSYLWSTPLKWVQVAWYMYQVPWVSVQTFKQHYGYYRNNLRGCNVGIAHRSDLQSMPLRWLHVVWCNYQVSWRLVETFRQY